MSAREGEPGGNPSPGIQDQIKFLYYLLSKYFFVSFKKDLGEIHNGFSSPLCVRVIYLFVCFPRSSL